MVTRKLLSNLDIYYKLVVHKDWLCKLACWTTYGKKGVSVKVTAYCYCIPLFEKVHVTQRELKKGILDFCPVKCDKCKWRKWNERCGARSLPSRT